MKQITYDNKVNLNTNPDVPRINKVIDEDLNEIKRVVNENSLRSIITAYPGQSLKPTSGVTLFPLQNIRTQRAASATALEIPSSGRRVPFCSMTAVVPF